MQEKSHLQRLIGFLSIIFLAGCATLSQEECVRGDWFGLGIRDGHAGETNSRLYEHQKACSEYGIALNNEAYFAGREQGLWDYCRLDNAFRTGLEGQPYRHVCPPSIDALFQRYHSAAFAVYAARADLDRLDDELSSREYNLQDKKLTDKERARIRHDIRDLDRRRDQLRHDLYYHERLLDDFRREANSYR
ncbi:DUF2799 domain-containing protein [Methylomonas sp. LL1]|uniref:DUF2799 domain-containing protein n=1 Tax=Methylomonas sp. LL1 TaxID=2785785 RepID=UPI0018C35E7C|nr:DUF2799 domain-containing protein [Methylomonas sp. LL1]QPK63232.1 DUF2799 domain-containing protein [Methylomonas sp. LL1]